MNIKEIMGFMFGFTAAALIFIGVVGFPVILAIGLLNVLGVAFYTQEAQWLFIISYITLGMSIDFLREFILNQLMKQKLISKLYGRVGTISDFLCTVLLIYGLDFAIESMHIGTIEVLIFGLIFTLFSKCLNDFLEQQEAKNKEEESLAS